jgi:hypothetical protein
MNECTNGRNVRSICNISGVWQVETFWNPGDSFLLRLLGWTTGTFPASGAEIEELKAKAEAVHVAALNLSNTLGIFTGSTIHRKPGLWEGQRFATVAGFERNMYRSADEIG